MSIVQKQEVKYGLIMGLALMIWIGLEFFFAKELKMPRLSDASSLLIFLVPMIAVYLALREKKRAAGNNLSYIEAIRCGLLIGLVSGLLASIFLVAYLYANPQIISGYVTYISEMMREAGQNEEAINDAITNLTGLYSPPMQGFFMLVGSMAITLIFSSIFGFFLKTKPIGAKT